MTHSIVHTRFEVKIKDYSSNKNNRFSTEIKFSSHNNYHHQNILLLGSSSFKLTFQISRFFLFACFKSILHILMTPLKGFIPSNNLPNIHCDTNICELQTHCTGTFVLVWAGTIELHRFVSCIPLGWFRNAGATGMDHLKYFTFHISYFIFRIS